MTIVVSPRHVLASFCDDMIQNGGISLLFPEFAKVIDGLFKKIAPQPLLRESQVRTFSVLPTYAPLHVALQQQRGSILISGSLRRGH